MSLAPRTAAVIAAFAAGATSLEVRLRFGLQEKHATVLKSRYSHLIEAARVMGAGPRHRTPAIEQRRARSDVRPSGSPLPRRRRLFSKHTDWVEFELERVDLGGRVLVPSGALVTNGDRASRCEVVP